MKVLFSNPPWWVNRTNGSPICADIVDGRAHVYCTAGIRAGSRWPFTQRVGSVPDRYVLGDYCPYPHFLGYATTYLSRVLGPSHIVRFRDSIATRESYARYLDHVEVEKYDFLVIESATPSWPHDLQLIHKIKARCPETKIIITGPIAGTLATSPAGQMFHAVIKGEYEKGCVRVIAGGESGVIEHDLLTVAEMNAQPIPYMDANHSWRYWDACPVGNRMMQLQVWSSRGCVYKCLAGDTPVNTLFGAVPIRELVGLEVPVFTYDPVEKKAKVCTATNIRQTGSSEKLVRVHFDDESHIDCTPDHRFLAFKWGNQHVGEREWECEAKDLKPGTHVRALKFGLSGEAGDQYMSAAWSRKGHDKVHRMSASWKIGRPVLPHEHVHHDDRNKLNNFPGNLLVFQSAADHFDQHPEIAERMRVANPTANGIDEEWRGKIGKANRGKVRSEESKARYREAAKRREASMTPEKKAARAKKVAETMQANGTKRGRVGGKKNSKGQFVPEAATEPVAGPINHRVVRVEELPGLHDTYCLEVPETGWFYANNVLVHNCIFCVWPAAMTGNDPDGTKARSIRHYSAEYMLGYLSKMVRDYGYQSVYFDDDIFNLGNPHTLAMCGVMRKIGLPWTAMCRIDTVSNDTWKEMKDSGCVGIKAGFESGNQYVVDQIVNKHLDLDRARETVHYLKKIGLTVHGTFTYGLPGETREQMQDTKKYIASLPLDSKQESGTACIEGTPLHALELAGSLKKFPGAKIDDEYERNRGSDGNVKMAALAAELRES